MICNLCGGSRHRRLFTKPARDGKPFSVYRCAGCSLAFTWPVPDDLGRYYEAEYFGQRTDRGYDNYLSAGLRAQIERVFRMNLTDIGFDRWRATRGENRRLRSLDIGCAAGYFVRMMAEAGFDAEGIEISRTMADFARDHLRLAVHSVDYLDFSPQAPYDLITLWATLEHLCDPLKIMKKIARDVAPGGLVIISTCRDGLVSRLFGRDWRYYNLPEHLYFFPLGVLRRYGQTAGLRPYAEFSYGSGLTARANAGIGYRWRKRAADAFCKKFNQGDMVVMAFRKDA